MDLDARFEKAQGQLNSLPDQSPDVKLQIYSLYKQATEGDVSGKKPGMLDFVKKAKFEAWETRKGLSKEQAKQEYIKLIDSLLAK